MNSITKMMIVLLKENVSSVGSTRLGGAKHERKEFLIGNYTSKYTKSKYFVAIAELELSGGC